MRIMSLTVRRRLFLQNQAHRFHSAAVFRAGGNDINPRCVDAAVTENVRQLFDVFLDPVEYPCEQMAQVMGKDLLRVDAGLLA